MVREEFMNVTAWNNGTHKLDGNGYGVKIDAYDRDTNFKREWKTIFIDLEGESLPIEINIDKPSFWNDTCRELISVKIGKWLIKTGLAPWENRKPPQLALLQTQDNRFRLTRL
jgi:hypothetical protein